VRPKNFNKAAGVEELERCARQMRVPSRGSAVSLVFRFPRDGRLPFLQPSTPCSRDIPRLGERFIVVESLGTRQPSSFGQIHLAVREPRPTKLGFEKHAARSNRC
jgi:hypothetical protein